MRQASDGSSREELQALGPWHHPSGCGRPAGQTKDTVTVPVGAGPWHGRKWSPEAKHGHVGCQKSCLDGSTESDPSEQNDTMRSHGTFLHFHIAFTDFSSCAAPPKTVSSGGDSACRPSHGSCRGLQSIGPMAASQRLLQADRAARVQQ
jgi:hypothetical protein